MKTVYDYYTSGTKTYRDLSGKTGIDHTRICGIVRGKINVSLQAFMTITRALLMPDNEAVIEWQNRQIKKIKDTANGFISKS